MLSQSDSSVQTITRVSERATDQGLTADVGRLEGSLTLRGGEVVQVRAIRADDDERLRAFHRRLSTDAIVFRFFHVMPELSAQDARLFTHVDYINRMALVATTGTGTEEQILGVVRYERIAPETAEIAFVVADHWQGHGIATALLHRLAGYAREHGVTTFVAITMSTNAHMLGVLRHSGYPCTMQYRDTDIEAHLDIVAHPAPGPAEQHDNSA